MYSNNETHIKGSSSIDGSATRKHHLSAPQCTRAPRTFQLENGNCTRAPRAFQLENGNCTRAPKAFQLENDNCTRAPETYNLQKEETTFINKDLKILSDIKNTFPNHVYPQNVVTLLNARVELSKIKLRNYPN